MKNLWVIVLASVSVAYAGYVDAAPKKKRTRSANRIGAYAGVQVGYTKFSADQAAADEQELENTLEGAGIDSQNITSGTEDTDLGYQATFGYRFHRYFAAEFGLVQFGARESRASGDVDFDDGDGLVPTTVKYQFSVGGPMISAIGILPLNEKLELFARLGYLLGSVERKFSASIDGHSAGSGSLKGDSQKPVYGLGFAWHINQMYSIRAEYQQLDEIGQPRTGQEDLKVMGLGLIVRF
jgi:hypothetical protein